MSNPLHGLKIDSWYKAVIVICTALLVVCLTIPLQGVSNATASIICIGGLLIGLGEWINHPYQEKIGQGYKVSGHPRNSSVLGVLFLITGVGVVGYGIYRLFL